MGKKNLSDIAAAASSKKASNLRRKAEIKMVNAVGGQINQMVSTICNAAVESRRIDFEGLESKDRAAVLMSEGTTLQAMTASSNEAVVAMWESMAPTMAAFLAAQAGAEATRAEAQLLTAKAEMLTAETREREVTVKEANAETEALKAETAREAAREFARSPLYNGAAAV